MSYDFHSQLSKIWNNAVELYKSGNSEFHTFNIDSHLALLQSWGLKKIDVFDFVEDWCLHQEPDFNTFLLVHYERWSFFRDEQQLIPSKNLLDPATLPPKNEAFQGITWLPRILPKARAKLRGELPQEVMYGCGGDREFFRTNNIHPAEFLQIVRSLEDDSSIMQWVVNRKRSLA